MKDNQVNMIDDFIEDPDQQDIYKKLVDSNIFDEKAAESIIHALSDIASSVKKIYYELMPEIKSKQFNVDELQDKVWDIREEIRHIDYHIKDAKLKDL